MVHNGQEGSRALSVQLRSLYDLVTPKSLQAWHGVRVANMMVHNGLMVRSGVEPCLSSTQVGTTNNVFNMSLYDLVTPKSLLAWHGVRVANMMVHNH